MTTPKFLCIGCGVFRTEMEHLAAAEQTAVEFQWLPQGLHAVPSVLQRDLQAAIDAVSPSIYTAILVAYGLCSRGAEGIRATHTPLVLPRTHDCIAAFLGSHQRYLKEFNRFPGTYWFTRGFIDAGGQPGIPGKHKGIFKNYEQQYEEYESVYGEEVARYLIEEWDQRWIRNYQRAAYVHWEHDHAAEDRALTEECAEHLGWRFEELPADFGMLTRFLTGDWHPDEFLVVQPGQQVVATHDQSIFAAMSPAEAAALSAEATIEEIVTVGATAPSDSGDTDSTAPASDSFGHLRHGLGLGIDAGGTYTDVVLYDFANETILDTAKGLTTPSDPAVGIAEAIGNLNLDRLQDIQLVSLATTFATNAIVEDKGRKAGLILIGYDEWGLERISHRPCRLVPGAHRIDGSEATPLDEDALRTAILDLRDNAEVEAIGLVSVLGCRNPDHERHAQQIAQSIFDGPVICGYELSSDLDSLRRAMTVAINGRLGPIVDTLLQGVQTVLDSFSIHAPVMIVRADGSLMQVEESRRRPVEMILSGPAGSLCGAKVLTGCDDALVIDMGGTTSDIAVLRGGRPAYANDGARIGPHRTTVKAPDLRTFGLGGDSHLRLDRDGHAHVGPRRVLPLCYLGATSPSILKTMKQQAEEERTGFSPVEFFTLRQRPPSHMPLSDKELRIIDAISTQPRTLLELAYVLDESSLYGIPVDRLESAGYILRAGLTPTDILHIDGTFTRWHNESSETALRTLAHRHRIHPESLHERLRNCIDHRLTELLALVSLGLEGEDITPYSPSELFLQAAVGNGSVGAAECRLRITIPIVGIGAPIGAFLPEACKRLQTEVIIPNHSDVAGAVGAITGSIVQHTQILIRQDESGGYRAHAPDTMKHFARLNDAKSFAREHVLQLAHQQALRSGAERFDIRIRIQDRQAPLAEGGVLYIETLVTAEASGRPTISAS